MRLGVKKNSTKSLGDKFHSPMYLIGDKHNSKFASHPRSTVSDASTEIVNNSNTSAMTYEPIKGHLKMGNKKTSTLEKYRRNPNHLKN